MMELKDEKFWEDLRRAIDEAETAERREFEAAERLLAELDQSECEPLADERIDEIVQTATTDTGGGFRFSRLRRSLAAAAALLIAPHFLIAATAVTTVTVVAVTMYLSHTTLTLEYEKAILLATDEDQPIENRRGGQRRLVGDLVDSIELLREVAGENSALGTQAKAVLESLRVVLDRGAPFEPGRFPDPHDYLGNLVADRNLALEEREDALRRLAEQVFCGITALKAIEASPAPEELLRDNRVFLEQLARQLAR